MTLAESLALEVGDYVTHPATAVPNKPIRVTDIWRSDKSKIVLVRLASIDNNAWLDALGYSLPPAGKEWCKPKSAWLTKAEVKALGL